MHIVMPELPLPPAETGLTYTLTAARFNHYWDSVYLASDGWSRGDRTATTSYNCHGHSSGRKHWMEIQPSLNDDYDKRTTAEWIREGAIYGNTDHTGMIAGTLIDVPGSKFAISKISEKFAVSAVYEREFATPIYYVTGEKIPVVGSPFFAEYGAGAEALKIPLCPIDIDKFFLLCYTVSPSL